MDVIYVKLIHFCTSYLHYHVILITHLGMIISIDLNNLKP